MRMKIMRLGVLAILLAVHGLAWGDWDDRDEGIAAAQRGDYDTAMREWRPLAEQGYIEA
jgi:hypothetical protein